VRILPLPPEIDWYCAPKSLAAPSQFLSAAVLQKLNKSGRNRCETAEFYTVKRIGTRPPQANRKKTTTMKTCIHILGAMAIATSLTFAQDGPKGPKGPDGPGKKRPDPEKVFKKLDADSSGSVSLEEFKAGPRAKEDPAKAEEIFKKIDKDGNGELSLEEFKSHRPPHRRGPGKRGGDGAPPAE